MWNKLINAVQLFFYKLFPVKYHPGPFFAAMFNVRAAQAAATVVTTIVAWIGDSRLHEFEDQINAIAGWLCQGIGGTKLTDWLNEWKKVIGPMLNPNRAEQKLKVIVDDTGGNDFLGGADLQTVLANKRKLIAELKEKVDVVLTLEIVPLNPAVAPLLPNWQEVNEKMILFNTIMAAERGADYVALPQLSEKGVGMNSYFISDGIHFNLNAWPIIENAVQVNLKARGLA